MDSIGVLELSVFVFATFAGALIAGIVGFAFGLVAAGLWLHVLTPTQSTILIVAFGLTVQAMSVWRLRRALRLERLLPFIIGGAIGVPVGVVLLRAVPAAGARVGMGVILVAFSIYSLMQPKLPHFSNAGKLADAAIGVASGIVGGSTGLAGILAVMWCTLRGWPKDEQRGVFQPVAVFIFILTALWLGVSGSIDSPIVFLYLLGLPSLLAGTWIGLKLYGRINETIFRRIVLALLLASGLSLIV